MNLFARGRTASVCAGPSTMACALGVCVSVCLLSLNMLAQGNAGRILGAVTDSTGSAIVGAGVTVTDLQRGISRNLVTDEAGQYFAPNLLPGMYKVRAEAKGFKSVERPNIQLAVGNDVRIDLALPPGNVSEVIEVMDEIPLWTAPVRPWAAPSATRLSMICP